MVGMKFPLGQKAHFQGLLLLVWGELSGMGHQQLAHYKITNKKKVAVATNC